MVCSMLMMVSAKADVLSLLIPARIFYMAEPHCLGAGYLATVVIRIHSQNFGITFTSLINSSSNAVMGKKAQPSAYKIHRSYHTTSSFHMVRPKCSGCHKHACLRDLAQLTWVPIALEVVDWHETILLASEVWFKHLSLRSKMGVANIIGIHVAAPRVW